MSLCVDESWNVKFFTVRGSELCLVKRRIFVAYLTELYQLFRLCHSVEFEDNWNITNRI